MPTQMSMNKNGFTLVELAIVMVIVGLLIGGVIKGQELMFNARITATIAQVKSYQAAIEIFRDRYGVHPGDYQGAQTRLPGCTAVNFCFGGNGDSLIGVPGNGWNTVDSTITSENVQFWKHLASADLISGVEYTSGGPPQWGITHPASRLNGGFHIRHAMPQGVGCFGANSSCINGTILVLRLRPDGVWVGAQGRLALRPSHAAMIDRKMDDGIANLGFVHAVSSGFNTGCGQPNDGNQDETGYDYNLPSQSCDLMLKM